MKNVVGKSVSGENFFGRDAELKQLLALTTDQHVLVLAPRRVGKTSLLRALQTQLERDQGITPVYTDVSSATSEARFVESVLEAVYETEAGKAFKPGRIASWRKRRKSRLKSVQIAGNGIELEAVDRAWQDEADHAFAQLIAADQPWLIMIDELPILAMALAKADPTGTRVRTFLQWFRSVRQRPRAADKLRFVLAGSIGLDNVTRRFQMSDTINDLRDWQLGPFSPDTADQFLRELASGYRLNLAAATRAAILDHVEWLIPYHLQLVFGELLEHRGGRKISTSTLDAAIEVLLARKRYFSYWNERLTDALGAPADDQARAVLEACARDPSGATATTIRQALAVTIADAKARLEASSWIVDVLVHDGYLVEHAERWRFRSGLLRRYWMRHCL